MLESELRRVVTQSERSVMSSLWKAVDAEATKNLEDICTITEYRVINLGSYLVLIYIAHQKNLHNLSLPLKPTVQRLEKMLHKSLYKS